MTQTWGLIVAVISIIGIAFGRYPKMKMNRATISLVGSTVLILINAITLEDAYSAIDLNTIVLIFSMMILNVNLKIAGFFGLVASKVVKFASSSNQLLFLLVFSSGILSALFLNDTIVLMFTPLILEIVIELKLNPIPYLIALATSANIGSAATIVGNPQNMLIGVYSKISFIEFSKYLIPVSIVSLFLTYFMIKMFYSKDFSKSHFAEVKTYEPFVYRPLLIKSIISLCLMLAGFLFGIPVSLAALAAASLLLFTRRIKPDRVFREIDWSLLVFFSGLFIITFSLNKLSEPKQFFEIGESLSLPSVIYLTSISAILSNLISNVPAVMILGQLINNMEFSHFGWLIIAMSTTFAGNLTLLGSVANMIVAESAQKRGIKLEFIEYLKVGIPLTIITLILGIAWFAILIR